MSDDPFESVPEPLLEALATIEHARWSDWQRYLHGQCQRLPTGSLVIPAAVVAHWEHQIATPYADLTDREKESDRNEVRRYWPTVARYLTEQERSA